MRAPGREAGSSGGRRTPTSRVPEEVVKHVGIVAVDVAQAVEGEDGVVVHAAAGPRAGAAAAAGGAAVGLVGDDVGGGQRHGGAAAVEEAAALGVAAIAAPGPTGAADGVVIGDHSVRQHGLPAEVENTVE